MPHLRSPVRRADALEATRQRKSVGGGARGVALAGDREDDVDPRVHRGGGQAGELNEAMVLLAALERDAGESARALA